MALNDYKRNERTKQVNGGPNKVRGLEKIEKLISGGDVYLAPESKAVSITEHAKDIQPIYCRYPQDL